jgi:hypothetical protein
VGKTCIHSSAPLFCVPAAAGLVDTAALLILTAGLGSE